MGSTWSTDHTKPSRCQAEPEARRERSKAQGGGRTATVQAEAPSGPQNRYLPRIACAGQEAPIRDGEADFAILEAGAWTDAPTSWDHKPEYWDRLLNGPLGRNRQWDG